MELGKGPCLQARASGAPVFLPDLAAADANRWPAFAAAALAVGVHAEFSLPLTAGPGGIGTLDLCRDRPGMLSEEHLADALVTADIARDAVLYQQYTPAGRGVAELLDMGADRIVIHQATGMIAAQLNDTTSNALARLRAAAFASGRPAQPGGHRAGKGMLAEYLKMSVDDAFRLLRSYTRDHNRKLSDVARDVVDRKIPSTALIT
jgi:hypothetical protein